MAQTCAVGLSVMNELASRQPVPNQHQSEVTRLKSYLAELEDESIARECSRRCDLSGLAATLAALLSFVFGARA